MITKNEFINRLAKEADITKGNASIVYDAFINVIRDALVNGEEITMSGLGGFKLKDVPEQTRRNPKTGEEFVAKAHKQVKFKLATAIKDAVKELPI